jgi:acyl dehydratase
MTTQEHARAPAKQDHERYFDDVSVGDEGVTRSVVVTKAMIGVFADLTGDHTPIHVDEDFAKASHFGGVVAHGLFGLALADGLKTTGSLQFPPGASLGWTWDFLKPIYAGDEVRLRYRVASMRATRKPEWGILHIAGELLNQRDEVVQKGEHKVMILRRPPAPPAG